MTYFKPRPTLPDFGDEFRFAYNENTGGGQSFLAGKYRTPSGETMPLANLKDQLGVFEFVYPLSGQERSIPVGTELRYQIKPRSQTSTSMKLAVGKDKPNPSSLIATFLMLPPTCTPNASANPDFSPLASGNFWLQSMLLEAKWNDSDSSIVTLVSSEFVFAGRGASHSAQIDPIYFDFRSDQRIRDVLSIYEADFLPRQIQERLGHFADIYSGDTLFSYEESRFIVASLMRRVAREYPDRYSGVDDPLPLLDHLRVSRSTSLTTFTTGLEATYERNIVSFGAPGTGKSYRLNQWKDELLGSSGNFERVTFHPEYSYAQFIGTYKPVPAEDGAGNETVSYKFVPGPFLRVLADALSSAQGADPQPYILLIEELNRAPAASVFGDVFQLLDRDDTNTSRYPIHPSKDVQTFLAEQLGGVPTDYRELGIPDNMFIWASMNSADQGVFPLDTAFKRRWNFKYVGINENEQPLLGMKVALPGTPSNLIEWNTLRRAINDLLAELGVNEDKQLGPFFLDRDLVVPSEGDIIDPEPFLEQFREKVLMYLFEDAARQHRASFFQGCEANYNRYSDICSEFDRLGLRIFNERIVNQVQRDLLAPG